MTSTLGNGSKQTGWKEFLAISRRENDLRASVSLAMDCRRTVSEKSSDFAYFEIFLFSRAKVAF